MTTSARKIALEEILLEHKDRFMRVSEIRDLLISKCGVFDADKAQLRRWIYSCFLTMEKKGRLEKQNVPGTKKWRYRLVASETELATEANISFGDADSELDEVLSQLEDQLVDNQRSSRIYLSQLNTFKAMKVRYPQLSDYAETRYQSIFEKSYDLLGRIKALEETLTDHGRSIKQCH